MKSYKEILNEWAQQTDMLHVATDSDIKKIQSILLEMYIDIDRFCEENGLVVMLGGGSCIGAIRHKGFIPWDDDLDLMMGRPDYNKLIELLKDGGLSDKYDFRYPDGKMETSCGFLKIYHRTAKMISFGGEKERTPLGLFIDIFPIEGTSSNPFVRFFKGMLSNTLRFLSNCVDESDLSASAMKAYKEYPELYQYKRKRILIGKLFSIIGSKKLRYWGDQLVQNTDLSNLTCVPTSRKLYLGEVQPGYFKFPSTTVPFEGYMAKVPLNYDLYLTDMYGDYMQIPPVEKRERHFYMELKLD